MKRFVILAAPRTGSNLLCTLLQSHPDVLCHHELFNPGGVYLALPLRQQGTHWGSLRRRQRDPLGFLHEIWQAAPARKAVGFKMTHRQQAQVFDYVCKDRQVHKIVLRRRAQLKTYVSRLIAERSGVWEDYQHAPAAPVQPVEVNYRDLKHAVAFNQRFYASLKDCIDGPCTDVTYEELLQAHTQHKLLSDLGLPEQRLSPASRRQNPYPLTALISNWPELLEQLSQAQEDRMLYEELVCACVVSQQN